jgi:hypothetical protein
MLTDIEVKRAKAQNKPYKLSDSGNLYLWVTPGKDLAVGVQV